jgi:hypothetical protein
MLKNKNKKYSLSCRLGIHHYIDSQFAQFEKHVVSTERCAHCTFQRIERHWRIAYENQVNELMSGNNSQKPTIWQNYTDLTNLPHAQA